MEGGGTHHLAEVGPGPSHSSLTCSYAPPPPCSKTIHLLCHSCPPLSMCHQAPPLHHMPPPPRTPTFLYPPPCALCAPLPPRGIPQVSVLHAAVSSCWDSGKLLLGDMLVVARHLTKRGMTVKLLDNGVWWGEGHDGQAARQWCGGGGGA